MIEGLKTLTIMVNQANNLAGAMDHRDAVAVLTTLHKAGYRLEPSQMYAWALANGWNPRGAARLKEMAEKLNAGVRLQMKGTYPLRSDILATWRDKAAGSNIDGE